MKLQKRDTLQNHNFFMDEMDKDNMNNFHV